MPAYQGALQALSLLPVPPAEETQVARALDLDRQTLAALGQVASAVAAGQTDEARQEMPAFRRLDTQTRRAESELGFTGCIF